MTLGEFRNATSSYADETEMVVRKHDPGQLCCDEAVPVARVSRGSDWHRGRLMLHPAVLLSTAQAVRDERTLASLRDYASRCARYMGIVARLSRAVSIMPEGPDKDALTEIVGAFLQGREDA